MRNFINTLHLLRMMIDKNKMPNSFKAPQTTHRPPRSPQNPSKDPLCSELGTTLLEHDSFIYEYISWLKKRVADVKVLTNTFHDHNVLRPAQLRKKSDLPNSALHPRCKRLVGA